MSSLPKTVTRQSRDCDLNQGPSAPESSTLTTRLPSHPVGRAIQIPQLQLPLVVNTRLVKNEKLYHLVSLITRRVRSKGCGSNSGRDWSPDQSR